MREGLQYEPCRLRVLSKVSLPAPEPSLIALNPLQTTFRISDAILCRADYTLADFELIRRLGDGSYSQVVLARHKGTGQEVALKIMDKRYLMRHKMVEYIRQERAILDALRHPGIARLLFTFQDKVSLYMGIEHCPNGVFPV